MKKVLLAGASGALGMEVAKQLSTSSVPFRALVSNNDSAKKLEPFTADTWVADAQNPHELEGMCDGVSHVFSSLGKSVSLFTSDHQDYEKIDYECNKNILREAEKAGVERFIYSSILGSGPENKLHLARVHYQVQQLLEKSPVAHTVIKPTGFFSGLHDLVIMGKKGLIPVIGPGDFRTNPIHHMDLAKKAMEVLSDGPETIEVGGPEILTRKEIALIIQQKTKSRIIHLPEMVVRMGLPVFSLLTKDLSTNLDFFTYVTTRDMIAPSYGSHRFQDYIDELDLEKMP